MMEGIFMYTTFRELTLFTFSGDCHYTVITY